MKPESREQTTSGDSGLNIYKQAVSAAYNYLRNKKQQELASQTSS